MFLRSLKETINRKINYIVNRQNRSLQTVFSFMQLSNLFNEEVFIPMTSWSISPNLILHVLNDIDINNRKCIVEFGTGASTIYIAKLLQMTQNNAFFYSIESDAVWAEKIRRKLQSLQLLEYVIIILAPKTEVYEHLLFKDQKLWYNAEILNKELKDVTDIDLVLVDGPSGKGTPYSRFSAIPFLKEKLSLDYSIFLDDTNRLQERQIADNWKKYLNCNIRYKEKYAHLSTAASYSFFPYQI